MGDTLKRHSWIRASHAALSGLLVGLLAAGPAVAQAPLRLVPRTVPAAGPAAPKVVVVAVALEPTARSHAARLAQLGERAVAESGGRFALVELAGVLDAEGTRAREAKVAEADAAYQAGLKAYDELDTEKALQQFDQAAKAYEAADLRVHFAGVGRARVMKVASQVANGETKAAELAAEAVLAMDPKATFSPNHFPPEFIAFVEKTRKAVLAQADGGFEVSTAGVPALLYVDGEYRGITPAKVSGLTRADHFVTLVAPGHATVQGRVRDGEASFTLEPVKAAPRLQAVVDRMVRDPQGPGRDAAAVELGNVAGSQQVLVLLARGGTGKAPLELTALRVDVVDGHNWGYATLTAPNGDGLEESARGLLATVLGTDTPRAGGPVTHFGSGKSGGPRRTVGFVLLATGAALLAGGVYFGLEASSRADSIQRLAQTDPRSASVRSEGQTFALFADIGMVAGLASAGVGSWLAFFGNTSSGGGSVKKAVAVKEEPSRPEKPAREALPMPPPPSPEPKPAREALPMPPAPKAKEPAPTPASTTTTRPEEGRRGREEAARREREQREQEEKRKREEAARREQELEVQRKREAEEASRRQREQEEQRKREEAERRKREEEKKKRPALDDDDLRNY